MDDYYIFKCPHCDDYIQVLKGQLNCKIFRHGVMKDTLRQVNPHLPKKNCDDLISRELVYGCCKPFRVIDDGKGNILDIQVCNYI